MSGVCHSLDFPRVQARLMMVRNGGIVFDFTAKRPNWFRRIWYWALLGWTWRKV